MVATPALSIVIALACPPAHVESVVGALLRRNEAVLRRGEVILADGLPNAGNGVAVAALRRAFPWAAIEYLEVRTGGIWPKYQRGLEAARGDYVLFLVDECVSMYDFLGDALEVAKRVGLCSIPYLEAQAPDSGSYPLRYPRLLPAPPVTFMLAPRERLPEMTKGFTPFAYATWHWTMLCWELGMTPAFAARHVRYCPIVKMGLDRPPVYAPVAEDLIAEGRRAFAHAWPSERVERSHRAMAAACERIAEAGGPFAVISGPAGGAFVVDRSDGSPLPSEYRMLGTAAEVGDECARALDAWRESGYVPATWTGGAPARDSRGKSLMRRAAGRARRTAGR